MRDIKFRAYDSSNGMWFPDSLTFDKYGKMTMCFQHNDLSEGEDIKANLFCGRDFHLQQYTGLKDKNGAEIYEGDVFIVKSLHDGDEGVWNQDRHNSGGDGAIPQVVEWSERRLGFEFGDSTRIKYEPYDFEVIGNIWETPELLK